MNKVLRALLGLLISGVCLWLVLRGFKLSDLRSSLTGAAFVWILPTALIFVINFLLRTLRWQVLLSPLSSIRFRALFPVLMAGFFVNNLLPARAGEFVRAAAAAREGRIPVSASLGSIVAERLSDFTGLFFIMLVASALIPWEDLPVFPVAIFFGSASIVLALFVLFVDKYKNLGQTAPAPVRKIAAFLFQIPDGFKSLKSVRKVVAVILLSVVIWSNEAFQVWLMSRVTRMDLSVVESAGVIVGLSVGVMIPAAPGYVGTYELFGKEVLVKLGHAAAPALSFILILHFFQILMMAGLGLPSLLKIYSQAKPAP